MADPIQIPLEVTGIPKSKREVEELLDKIKLLSLALGSMADKESAAYKETEAAVKQLQGTVDSYNNSKGTKNVENTARSFVKIGSAITSSFAAAQAAISLFGSESEAVAQAAAKAQGLLTIALASREIAEAGAAVKTVVLTTATIAQTAVTQGLTAATRLLFATFAANPLGAILAVIGLVIGAIVTLTDETNNAEAAEKKYQATLQKTKSEREFQISLIQAQGATELEVAQTRRANAERDLREARTRLLVLKETGANEKQINQELTVIAESKRIIALENARIDRMATEEQIENAEKLTEAQKKAAEERKAQLLDELKLLGDIRREELQRTTQGLEVNLPEYNSDLKEQNDLLKSLAKSQGDYNDVFDEYAKLFRKGGEVAGAIETNKMIYELPKEAQNIIKINTELIKSSLELAGYNPSDVQSKILQALLFTQSQFLKGVSDDTEFYIQNQEKLLTFERYFISSFVNTNIKGFQGSTEAIAEQRKILTDQAQVVFANLIASGNELVKVREYYKDAAGAIKNLSDENLKLSQSTEVLNGFLRNTGDLITRSFDLPVSFGNSAKDALQKISDEISKGTFDSAREFGSDIEQLEYTLLQNGIDIRNASYEEKLMLLKKFLEKEVKETEDAESKKQDAQQKTIEKFQQNIQSFQSALNAFAQSLGDFYELQFAKIENNYSKLQSEINDSTEEGQQKRLELEKQYTGEVEALQKKQAKAQLRISLAQTLANTAEAASKINAQLGAFGIIAQGIVVAAGIAQAAIITAQLNQIDSFARGGRLPKMAGGGYLQGPSHNNGGIKYQGGGVELEGRESVINRISTVQYADLLSSINMAGGGKPIVMNNFDDSRIVEAIARQRKEPIRAFVVESDITQKQTITKRLEQLSQI